MVDIYGSHFEYSGQSSRDHGLIIANVDTKRMTQLCAHGESVTKYSKSANKFIFVDEDNSNARISFDIEFVTEDGRCLEHAECRAIEKWLFRNNGYRKLYFDMDDDALGTMYEDIDGVRYRNYLNCIFVNPEKLEYNGGVVGFKATLEADSNMFWQDTITKIIDVNGGPYVFNDIRVRVATDAPGYIYPKVKIYVGNSGGNIEISNDTDDSSRITEFVDILQNATIVMNGETNYVSGQYYEKFRDRNFIRLLDGMNRFTITGDVSKIEFEYVARRMM